MNTPAVDLERIERAARMLLDGRLVAFPTETVYGLGADADRRTAVESIFRAKGRPSDHPLIVHVADAAAAPAWARDVSPAARGLMARFWPGPLTLVLARNARAHDALTGGQDTVGLRCPAHPWAQALLRAMARIGGDRAGVIAAPSANRYGHLSPTRAEHVRADLGEVPDGAVDMILDGGACTLGIESTIVDLSSNRPRLLRPGSIARSAIEHLLGTPVDTVGIDDASAPRAPGRPPKHYAPRRPLELVPAGELAARIRAIGPARTAVLAAAPPAEGLPRGRYWAAPVTPEAYAHHLYDVLHAMDASGAEVLLVERPPDSEAWAAPNDRLARSAAGSEDRFFDAD